MFSPCSITLLAHSSQKTSEVKFFFLFPSQKDNQQKKKNKKNNKKLKTTNKTPKPKQTPMKNPRKNLTKTLVSAYHLWDQVDSNECFSARTGHMGMAGVKVKNWCLLVI